MKAAAVLALVAVAALAQTDVDRVLKGAIDIHVHSASRQRRRGRSTRSTSRRLASARGMRAIVLKNHYDPTATLAFIVRKEVPGIEVFGGVDLNLTVGGMNAAAVEHMTQVSGGWGRLVWMSTFDAENQVRYSKENRPFVRVSQDGALVPEAKDVIARDCEAQPRARDRPRVAGRRSDAACAKADGRASNTWS